MRRSVGGRGVFQRRRAKRAVACPQRSSGSSAASRSPHSPLRLARLLLAATLAASWALLAAFAVSVPAVAAQADALKDSGALHIVVPGSSNGGPAGPVGTHITVQASGLTPNGAYKLGVALKDAGCQGGFSDLGQSTTADSSGGFAVTFQWPSSANATGSSYNVCAQSQADNSFTQSDSAFTVLSGNAPAITLKRVAAPASSGTPTPTGTLQPLPSGVYQAGDYVQIKGHNFLPGGTALAVYLTPNQITSAQDVQGLTPLQTVDQSTIASDDGGNFTATVQIPAQTQSAQYYLYVTSTDADTNTKAPPSLQASKQILVQLAPTPTPTATSTPVTPTPNQTPQDNGGGTASGGGGKPTAAIVALGIASVLLFIIGVILLASAASTPATGPERR